MTDETTKPKRPKFGGRRKGSLNKKTLEGLAAKAALEQELSGSDGKLTAHALVKKVYQNPKLPLNQRVRAAVDALRFEKAPEPDKQLYVVKMPVSFPNTEAGMQAWRTVAEHMSALAEANKAGAALESITKTLVDLENEIAGQKKVEPK